MKRKSHFTRIDSGGAFTLVELLVVIGVLVMLIAILVPSFSRVMQHSRSATCKNNLHQLSGILHAEGVRNSLRGNSGPSIPNAGNWVNVAVDQGLDQLVVCPCGGELPTSLAGLQSLWIRQDGHESSQEPGVHYSNLYDLLTGREVPDWQVGCYYRGKEYGTGFSRYSGVQWIIDLHGGPPADNEALLAIATCAAFSITFHGGGSQGVEIAPLGHHPDWSSGSDHWITRGDPSNPSWEDDVLVRLTGVGYSTIDSSVSVFGGGSHYGMNTLVNTSAYRMNQLWLVEYTSDLINLTSSHHDDPFDENESNGEIMARHLGRANLLKVDGSVLSMTKDELENEFDRLSQPGASIFQN